MQIFDKAQNFSPNNSLIIAYLELIARYVSFSFPIVQ